VKDIRQKLLATFQVEHRDHVEQIRSLLAMIESTGGQAAAPELEEVFRRAHSLKGAARAVDLRPIEELAHRLETLFSGIKKGKFAFSKEVTSVIQKVLDASEDSIASFADSTPAATVPAALLAIERVLGMEEQIPVTTPANPEVSGPAFQPLETIRITAQNFEGLFRSAGGLVTEIQRQEQVAEHLKILVREITLMTKEGQSVRRSGGESVGRRETQRLDPLTGPLNSMKQRLRSISTRVVAANRLHQRSAWSMRQLGNQLQQDVWQARMVSAENLFEGYGKMVRDLARDEGKEIAFRNFHTGVHADRRVLEALKDPIMHLLRNAVSHGIEFPAERARKGKPPAGVVTLQVETNGPRLIITIQDDGRGVDFSRVAEVAARDGILSDPAGTGTSKQDLTRILLRPGFSTSRAVTNLSGRGMGLSVVYEAVRRLQGDLDIQPVPGGGTLIAISVPLSVSTHRLVLVESGGQIFAIPTLGVERLWRVKVTSVETTEGKSVAILNNAPIVITSIPALLGLEHTPTRAESNMLRLVVLRSGSQRLAVAVDAVIRETDAVIQDLAPVTGCGGRISSGVALEDGAIAFVISPMELIQMSLQSRSGAGAVTFREAPAKPAEAPPLSILVVDDSMTTRTLEKSILEAHGYRVSVAVDGLAALEKLRQEKADLVIADVEMPRLNGFGLIEAMKKDRELARIPVIIVSSLEQREDRERGLALGADAYIVKRKFDQEELLAAIRQIL
jgi:two-component system, chemotaxis family, sensor kinase CheA